MSKTNANHVDSVEQVYAQALLEIAQEADQLADVGDQLKQLDELFKAHPDLLGLLSNKVVPTQERAESIDRIFENRCSDLLYRFLQVVNGKGRLDVLPGIIRSYAQLLDEYNGVVEVEMFVVESLSQEQVQRVAEAISAVVGQNVLLRQRIDPKLIGGWKVRVGDRLIDGSVATQLRLMRNRLVDTGRQRARDESGSWSYTGNE